MSSTSLLPTLSLDGFVSQGNMLMSKLFEYFLSSDYSQSNYYIGEIKSLKYLLSLNNRPNDLANAIKESLTELYSNYFNKVVTTCTVNKIAEDKYHIFIEVTGNRENNSYYLTKELKTEAEKIENFENELDVLYQHYHVTN